MSHSCHINCWGVRNMLEIKSNIFGKDQDLKIVDDVRELNKQLSTSNKPGEYYFIPNLPAVPQYFNKKLISQSYEVNLFNFTCSCDQFKENNIIYLDRDIRKACKHVYYKVDSNFDRLKIPQLWRILLKNAAIFGTQHYYKFKFKENEFYYGFKEDTVWVNIFANVLGDATKDYFQYGYNLVTNAWASRLEPKQKFEIIHILNSIVKYQLPFTPPYEKNLRILSH